MTVAAFRACLRTLRQQREYELGLSECIGMANVVTGIFEYCVGKGMECSPHMQRMANRHIDRGWDSINMGLQDCCRGVIVSLGIYYAARHIT